MSKLKVVWTTFLAFAIIGAYSSCQSQKAREAEMKNKMQENFKPPRIEDYLNKEVPTEVEAEKIISKSR